jgi:demethylmenaquinone methyltransferase/2-methoxy-6-polyprenyl-1,4-benzoquinol methylase
MGAILSIGQDPRWRRFLVSRVNAIPGSWVLDAATGTGLVARELARRNVRVAAVDQSEAMLRRAADARQRMPFAERIRLVRGRAERLPFADETFDAVTFTYLLRYVDDPAATVDELARVLRPGGTMASLEFHVPDDAWTRLGWRVYTRAVLPGIGWVVSPSWFRTGRFLGMSVTDFERRFPLAVQVRWWQEAGMRHVRTRVMGLGAGVITWAVKRTPVMDG